MLSFFRKKVKREPVQFTRVMREGAEFTVIFNEDILFTYQILEYCSSWDQKFSRFNFIIPTYSCSFFGKISNFEKVEFQKLSEDIRISEKAVILNFSTDQVIRKKLKGYPATMIIDGSNAGNLQFVPPLTDGMELFRKFAEFFSLELEQKHLEFSFQDSELKKVKGIFFQNKFLNFILDLNKISTDKMKEIIVTIKQNFPSNLYLSGQVLKKHEFINLRNLERTTLLDLYYYAQQSDLFISDDLDLIRIFADLDLPEIYITSEIPPNSIPFVNIKNVSRIKDLIASKTGDK